MDTGKKRDLIHLVGKNAKENLQPIDFVKQLDMFVYGDMPSSDFLYLAKHPTDVGLVEIATDYDFPILMKQSVVKKIEIDHKISVSSLKNLPELLKTHPISFDSLTVENALVVVCNAKDVYNGDIIVALHLEKEKRYVKLNEISSIYGKNNIPYLITNAIDLGKNVYTNINTADWIRRTGVLFPERIASRLLSNYTTLDPQGKYLINEDDKKWLIQSGIELPKDNQPSRLSPDSLVQHAIEVAQQTQTSQDHTYKKNILGNS